MKFWFFNHEYPSQAFLQTITNLFPGILSAPINKKLAILLVV
jgi:hypothetical protein